MKNDGRSTQGEPTVDGGLALPHRTRFAFLNAKVKIWIAFVSSSGLALVFFLAGRPLLGISTVALLVLWAWRDALFQWTSGISVLLLALLFIPSRVYRIPVPLPFDLDPYRLVLLVLVVIWLVQSFARRRFVAARTYLDSGVAFFLFAVIAAYAANSSRFVSADEFNYMLKMAAYVLSFPLTFFLVASTVHDSRQAIRLVDLLVVCGGIAGVLAVFERSTQFNPFYRLEVILPVLEHVAVPNMMIRGAVRVAGATAHPIAFAAIMAMLVMLSMVRWFEASSRRVRWVSAVCGVLTGTGLLLALSRTGVVGVAVGGLVLMVGLPRRRRQLTLTAFALASVVHLLFRGVIGTLFSIFTPSAVRGMEVGNDNGRLADYAWALPQLINRPLFGLGFGALNPERGARIIDNQYLGLAIETGLLGVFAFAFLMWRAISVPLIEGRRRAGESGAVLTGVAATSAVFAGCSATFDTLGFPQVTYLFFVLAGLAVVIVNDREDGDCA